MVPTEDGEPVGVCLPAVQGTFLSLSREIKALPCLCAEETAILQRNQYQMGLGISKGSERETEAPPRLCLAAAWVSLW